MARRVTKRRILALMHQDLVPPDDLFDLAPDAPSAPEIAPARSGESNVWRDGAGWTMFRLAQIT